jgi:hypothetical protein
MASSNPDFDFEFYRIEYSLLQQIRDIDKGAQGTVFESEFEGRPVAVKMMNRVANWDKISTELKMKLTMKHANIVETLQV